MRLITINGSCLKLYRIDPEMLHDAKRPAALIVQLKYNGHRYDFAVPLRSNISPSAPKSQYFPLPPRPTTKTKHRHGIHYIKMFPIKKSFTSRYRTEGDMFATIIKSIVDQNEKQIVRDCQTYLSNYEKGIKPPYSTNIDLLLKQMAHIN